ncbi:MAG: uncharacterized membrane protein YsdA (DUF1294 family) [Paraglaciecola sp.]|jgi:uncharacterized membrane protein YsdA (DUF1294 family)
MKIHYLPIYLLLATLTCSYYLGYTPLLLTLIYVLLSVVTYIAYAKDKAAARNDEWRVPEKTLQLLALCGGWPGALVAQQRLRHKTQKVSFRLMFYVTLVVNVAAFAGLHSPQGASILHTALNTADKGLVSLLGKSTTATNVLFFTAFRPSISIR